MANHAVHWGQGVFLLPHHFQTAERSLREEIMLSENWYEGYAYGLHRIVIDEEALSNWQVVLKTCHARCQDGSHIRYSESVDESSRLFAEVPKDAFTRDEPVMVYLVFPKLQMGRKNSDPAGSGDSNSRYLVESQEIADENEEGNIQTLEIRLPNVKLVVGDEGLAGYEVLPVMRLRRADTPEAAPEIDPEYIPPLLSCDAWTILNSEIIGGIYNYLGGRVESRAAQIETRGVAFESGHREDLELIFELYALNSALGYVRNLATVKGIHPCVAYMELCRVVGQLAIFRPERAMPEVPQYDHDDLGRCFYAVRQFIQRGVETGPGPIKRPFIGAGLQLQVQLEREWLSPTWAFFVGVDSKLSYREVEKLIRGKLKLKVGSTKQVDSIFRSAKAGVTLTPEPEAPRSLPGGTWSYWKVERESVAWRDVEETLSIGIRIDDHHIEGRIDGQQSILVRTDDAQDIILSFALFAMPKAQIK